MQATFKPWRSPGTPLENESDSDGSIGDDRNLVYASFVIGCDGANSTVRSLLGFKVIDRGFHYDWLVSLIRLNDYWNELRKIRSGHGSTPQGQGTSTSHGRHFCQPDLRSRETDDACNVWKWTPPARVHAPPRRDSR